MLLKVKAYSGYKANETVKSQKLPYVLESGLNDNVYLFIVGHGGTSGVYLRRIRLIDGKVFMLIDGEKQESSVPVYPLYSERRTRKDWSALNILPPFGRGFLKA